MSQDILVGLHGDEAGKISKCLRILVIMIVSFVLMVVLTLVTQLFIMVKK